MKDNETPLVAVVVLNYKGADDTIACLACLKYIPYPKMKLIVVDNHSQDDSVDRIRAEIPDANIFVTQSNLGFSGGCNLGIRKALEIPEVEYVWLLNNDTTVQPGCLQHLVNTGKKYPKAIIGSMLYYPNGRFQQAGNWITPWRGHVRYYYEHDITEGYQVESISGCSMLIPRSAIKEIGLLDERYFLYFEDNDYCFRAVEKGYTIRVSRESWVFHHSGATTGRNKPLMTYYYQRNRMILAKTHFNPMQNMSLQLYTLYRLFRSTIKSMMKGTPEAKADHRAFKLAVEDFYKGVEGKCPHKL